MSVVVAMIGLQAASALIGGISANSRRIKAKGKQEAAEAKLTALENNRQPVINPYENVSSILSNPAANLGVATQAAEMQIEQADISLANTLDTIRATGGGAGGATALAQAALQSKKGVSASIEQQEAQNEKLKAQGEQSLQQALANADAAGKEFMFRATEQREVAKLDRTDAQMQNAEAQRIQAGADITGAITGAIGGTASGLGSLAASGYDFK
jgi:hypothetical protein